MFRLFRAASTTILFAVLLGGLVSRSRAGLVVNEIFNAANPADGHVEFLVTADTNLQELDGLWFGDFTYDLRAVPEPAVVIPMVLMLAGAFFPVLKKGLKTPAPEPG